MLWKKLLFDFQNIDWRCWQRLKYDGWMLTSLSLIHHGSWRCSLMGSGWRCWGVASWSRRSLSMVSNSLFNSRSYDFWCLIFHYFMNSLSVDMSLDNKYLNFWVIWPVQNLNKPIGQFRIVHTDDCCFEPPQGCGHGRKASICIHPCTLFSPLYVLSLLYFLILIYFNTIFSLNIGFSLHITCICSTISYPCWLSLPYSFSFSKLFQCIAIHLIHHSSSFILPLIAICNLLYTFAWFL